MQNETHYYLLNGTVKKGSKILDKTKKWTGFIYDTYDEYYKAWLSSLQPCEIDESELDKVKNYPAMSVLNISNPIDITDIILEKDGKIYFKQPTEKQVDSNAVEFAEWIKSNSYMDRFTKEELLNRKFSICDDICWKYIYDGKKYTTKQLYEIFKNR